MHLSPHFGKSPSSVSREMGATPAPPDQIGWGTDRSVAKATMLTVVPSWIGKVRMCYLGNEFQSDMVTVIFIGRRTESFPRY